MAVAWMTSDQLIEAVKRKISFPISQSTFTEDDVLGFANEEIAISQVPSVLVFHEEYFVAYKDVPLIDGQDRYHIPERAVGMKLRDLFWLDSAGTMFEMTRISSDDRAFFQRNTGAAQNLHKFYFEGNDVVLTPHLTSPTGSLRFVYFLRPNQLVRDSRAITIKYFTKDVTVGTVNPNTLITVGSSYYYAGTKPTITVVVPGDLVTAQETTIKINQIPFAGEYFTISSPTTDYIVWFSVNTAGITTGYAPSINGTAVEVNIDSTDSVNTVASKLNVVFNSIAGPDFVSTVLLDTVTVDSASFGACVNAANSSNVYFAIDPSSSVTAANIQVAISGNSNLSSVAQLTATPTILRLYYVVQTLPITSSDVSIVVQSTQGIEATSDIPSNFTVGFKVDFIQSNPGFKTRGMDVLIPIGGISVTNLILSSSDIPSDLVVGDYINSQYEAIVPQIPADLHHGLAERTAARILAALGDRDGLAVVNDKIKEIEMRQGNMMDNRAEGAPQKITARHSLLRYGKTGTIRRY